MNLLVLPCSSVLRLSRLRTHDSGFAGVRCRTAGEALRPRGTTSPQRGVRTRSRVHRAQRTQAAASFGPQIARGQTADEECVRSHPLKELQRSLQIVLGEMRQGTPEVGGKMVAGVMLQRGDVAHLREAKDFIVLVRESRRRPEAGAVHGYVEAKRALHPLPHRPEQFVT